MQQPAGPRAGPGSGAPAVRAVHAGEARHDARHLVRGRGSAFDAGTRDFFTYMQLKCVDMLFSSTDEVLIV